MGSGWVILKIAVESTFAFCQLCRPKPSPAPAFPTCARVNDNRAPEPLWATCASIAPLDVYLYAFGGESSASRLKSALVRPAAVIYASAFGISGGVRRHGLRLSSGSSARNRAFVPSSREIPSRLHPRCFVDGIPSSRLAAPTRRISRTVSPETRFYSPPIPRSRLTSTGFPSTPHCRPFASSFHHG